MAIIKKGEVSPEIIVAGTACFARKLRSDREQKKAISTKSLRFGEQFCAYHASNFEKLPQGRTVFNIKPVCRKIAGISRPPKRKIAQSWNRSPETLGKNESKGNRVLRWHRWDMDNGGMKGSACRIHWGQTLLFCVVRVSGLDNLRSASPWRALTRAKWQLVYCPGKPH